MTDKEIIKALECYQSIDIVKSGLDLINRQQAEISEYKDKCERCGAKTRVCIENLQNNIAEKQAEIERLTTLSELGKMRADDYRVMRDRALKAEAEIERLEAFKSYFDELYGKGLDIANWHENGNLEPFDYFYDDAVKEMVGK
jgi:hypothetical protein